MPMSMQLPIASTRHHGDDGCGCFNVDATTSITITQRQSRHQRRRIRPRPSPSSSSSESTAITVMNRMRLFVVAISLAIVSGSNSRRSGTDGRQRHHWQSEASLNDVIPTSPLLKKKTNELPYASKSFGPMRSGSGTIICCSHHCFEKQTSQITTTPSLMASLASNRNSFLSSVLLQVRGGDDSFNIPEDELLDLDNVDEDVSAEDLLDSIFAIDDEPQKQPYQRKRPLPKQARKASLSTAKTLRKAKPKRSPSIDGVGRSRASKDTNAIDKGLQDVSLSGTVGESDLDKDDKNLHAFWGPNAAEQKTQTPSTPTPSRSNNDATVADSAILKARHHKKRQRDERNRLLSRIALNLHDTHVSAIHSLIKGGAAHVPPELFGETIAMEKCACDEKFQLDDTVSFSTSGSHLRAELESTLSPGSGTDDDTSMMLESDDNDPTEPAFRHIEDPALLSHWGLTPLAKLYGGAQYHRVLRYYHHLFLTSPLPPMSDDEVAILTNGISEVHDASDLMRAAALIVRRKMERVMEEVLADMTRRVQYVIERMWEMVGYSMTLHRPLGRGAGSRSISAAQWYDSALPSEVELYRKYEAEYANAEDDLKDAMAAAFRKFAEDRATEAYNESLEDVRSLLRYVTWDMGRARKRRQYSGTNNGNARNHNNQGAQQGAGERRGNWENNGGFISQIEIVSEEGAGQSSDRAQGEKPNTKASSKKKRKHKRGSSSNTVGRSNSRMVARGGGGHHRSRGRNGQSHYNDDHEEDEGDLIGGVMNRGNVDIHDDRSNNEESIHSKTSLVVSSTSSPLFSGDDEVLDVLLDTLSSSLVTNPDARASHTRAAIESLVSYMCDRTRTDISRIVRSKFNARFLLPFYEDLGSYLRKEVEAYLAKSAAATELDHCLD